MCEQTEVDYLDGDVVWVKLGSSWWPGQVVGYEKLPEDVQSEFKNKPLIAAVKFFDEESFEFVKNYQQIYKYNCTQKDDFIKKGLDKYRAKIKDGSNYMDKFPQDVKTAETLTNGNPNILLSEKFNPERKPDVSGLFGDKKISKRKRSMKQSPGEMKKRFSYPRYPQESDNEVRSRQQPKYQPLSTSATSSPGGSFPCEICGFTATRVNVIIFHLKSHRLKNETTDTIESNVKTNVSSKSRHTISDFPKRKYVKKSVPGKIKSETKVESNKRKLLKQIEKPSKKKKSDPQLREKLLADWNVDSDEEETSDVRKSLDESSTNLIKDQSSMEDTVNTDIFTEDSSKDNTDHSDLLHESSKLLEETDSFAKYSTLKDVSKDFEKLDNDENDLEKLNTVLSPKKVKDSFQFKKQPTEKFAVGNDDKNSRLSCFDFDEEDTPEPSISSVRKMTRGLGSKNMSIKKEIIKEFEMSQALKSDAEKDVKVDDNTKLNITKSVKDNLNEEILSSKDNENTEIVDENKDDKKKDEKSVDNCIEICETQVEIVEIFEEHRDEEVKDVKGENDTKFVENTDIQRDNNAASKNQSNNEQETTLKNDVIEPESPQTTPSNKDRKMVSDILTAEAKDKSTSLTNFASESKDDTNIDNTSNVKSVSQDLSQNNVNLSQNEDDLNVNTKKRRGRPRKSLTSTDKVAIDNEHAKMDKIDTSRFDGKTSDSDSDLSYTGRVRKPNTKYESSLYIQSFEHKSLKTDDSMSESDDKPAKMRAKPKRGRKSKSDFNEPANDSVEKVKKVESESSESVSQRSPEIKEPVTDVEMNLETKATSKPSEGHLKEHSKIVEQKVNDEQSNNDIELLPPKKSQIKKFELSLMDSSDNTSGTSIINKPNLNIKDSPVPSNKTLTFEEKIIEIEPGKSLENENAKIIVDTSITSKPTATTVKPENTSKIHQTEKCSSAVTSKIEDASIKTDVITKTDTIKKTDVIKKTAAITKADRITKTDVISKADTISKTVAISKTDTISKTDAIIKTVQAEPPLLVKKSDESSSSVLDKLDSCMTSNENKLDSGLKNSTIEPFIANYPGGSAFDNIEIVVARHEGIEVKTNQILSSNDKNDKKVVQLSNDALNTEKSSPIVESVILPTKKVVEPLNSTVTTLPLAEAKITVPVKKREKPRIIENVALKEPMILKTKLTEKTAKFRKHKLESDSIKLGDLKSPNTKMMKIETVISNNKNNLPLSSSQSLVAKKIVKPLKMGDVSSTNDARHETITNVSQTLIKVPSGEKFIQQSSQSLVDMDLDINSMPFVLSEDILTPESIEQMPVVISSVLPATPLATTLSTTIVTPTKQIVSANQLLESPLEINDVNSKKKSGTPTILKNKGKGKPTITSIKNVVPPLTSAYKGGFKVNTQPIKTIGNQKTPGKYVIVQTSGPQQSYSMHQKLEIPTSKGSGNAQIVQQGSKVVILTSPTSGPGSQKVLPLNTISKTLTNRKVQRIVTTKQGQIVSSPSPQGSKTVLTSKSGEFNNSPNSPKITGQKLVSHQQILAPKSVLTQMPGTITKSTALTNAPQGIISKDGLFTPITAATLGGKTIISSKQLLAKGFPSQGTSTKHILSPITQTLGGKTILSSQGIVSKGTVLTPITGSQVKALAARNLKGNKLQHQTIPHKLQLIEAQKSPKVPISSTQPQSPNVVVLQNADVKTVTPTKKSMKQTVSKQTAIAGASPSSSIVTMQPKGKIVSMSPEQQKRGSPKTIARMVKLPAKVTKDRMIEPALIQHKQTDKDFVPLDIKSVQDRMIGVLPKHPKVPVKSVQKKVSRVTASPVAIPSNSSASLPVAVPPVEPSSHEKIPKKEVSEPTVVPTTQQTVTQTPAVATATVAITTAAAAVTTTTIATATTTAVAAATTAAAAAAVNEVEKIDVQKISSQAQIMALPTENSDGTQSIVLFTVDEQGQGHIIPLDNNALVSLDGTSTIDGSRTIYIDSSSLGETGSMDNIVLQIDNSSLPTFQPTTSAELTPAVVTETLPTTEIPQNANQDILAAALANTDFQHDIVVPETTGTTAMTSFTQTSLINQTILQSTIIPPTEPISSPSVLETSLTLNQPIMTPLEVPSSISPQADLTPVSSTTAMPPSLKIPISIANSVPAVDETLSTSSEKKTVDVTVESSTTETDSKLVSNTHYSISIPGDDFNDKQGQITPSMPLIDDSFNANNGFDSTNTNVITEDNLRNYVTKTSEELIQDLTGNDSLQETSDTTIYCKTTENDSTCPSVEENRLKVAETIPNEMQDDSVSSQQNITLTIETAEETVITESIECSNGVNCEIANKDNKLNTEVSTHSTESPNEVQSSHKVQEFNVTEQGDEKAAVVTESTVAYEEVTLPSNQEMSCEFQPVVPLPEKCELEMVVEAEEQKPMEVVEEKSESVCQTSNSEQKSEPISEATEECKVTFEGDKNETSQEAPSQSYKQVASDPSDVHEVPSQSVKSENSREATQLLTYEPMEVDNNALVEDPPTQSYQDSKTNQASQSYKAEISTNAPTQSFNEMMEVSKERETMDETVDDPNFPTQSYEVRKIENCIETLEIDTEISQEGNIPSQSNDIGVDGIGTSSVSTNNSGLNEDETASSSYVPETPENQERDQDQESAISTSSYEIPPCEELNIASSSVIPDTSVQSEHSSIHDNGVPEIPTSSYNLNPDSSSAHVDTVPTSSYEDQIIIEQNVSTSHEVSISLANMEETGSQSYVTDSSDERNEATSYYEHNQEVSESYYQNICKQSHSELESHSEEEATPSYYETNPTDVTSEASGNYFNQEEATPSYSNHEISASYYNPQAGEASQSYYSSSHDLNASNQSVTLQNVEATQSFYNENSDEQRFRQQGEATPTYTERYPVDYAPGEGNQDEAQ